MPYCSAFVEHRSLFRGQTREYANIISSSWRDHWAANGWREPLARLVSSFLDEGLDRAVFDQNLVAIASAAKPGPTFFYYLGQPETRELIGGMLLHIRETFGPNFRRDIAQSQIEQLEESFNSRFHTFLFNESSDAFFKRVMPRSLRALAEFALEFYDQHRRAFNVEYRIAQVSIDLAGVLQQYGAIGTPGIDLTDDVEIALWFASHKFEPDRGRYRWLEGTEWQEAVVYEFHVPVVTFSPRNPGADDLRDLGRHRVVQLASLSNLFARIVAQHGWYAIDMDGWMRFVDFATIFPLRRTHLHEFGTPSGIQHRLESRLDERALFPGPDADPFKAHLLKHGVKTFY